MNIQEEIRQKQQEQQEQQLRTYHKHQNMLRETEEIIPSLVNDVKQAAIRHAVNALNGKGIIYYRGLLRRKKYIKVNYRLSQDDEMIRLRWYILLSKCPEVYGKIEESIDGEGLKNARVYYYKNGCYLSITAELDI